MICNKCGHENIDEAIFCNMCGNKLKPNKRVCPTCGQIINENDAFCVNCGTKVKEGSINKPVSKWIIALNIILVIAALAFGITISFKVAGFNDRHSNYGTFYIGYDSAYSGWIYTIITLIGLFNLAYCFIKYYNTIVRRVFYIVNFVLAVPLPILLFATIFEIGENYIFSYIAPGIGALFTISMLLISVYYLIKDLKKNL